MTTGSWNGCTTRTLTEPDEAATVLDLRTRRHAALYSLGRFEEADQDYAVIDALTSTVLDRPEATAVQIDEPDQPGPLRRGDRPGHHVAARVRYHRPGRGRPGGRSRSSARHMYWWLNRHRRRGRPGRRRGHRPRAGHGGPAAQRDAGVDVLRGRPGRLRLGGPAGPADLDRARCRTYPGRPGHQRRVQRDSAAGRLCRGLPGGAARPGPERGPAADVPTCRTRAT